MARRPKPPTREQQLREMIRRFVYSPKTVADYMAILDAGYFAYKPGEGIPPTVVKKLLVSVFEEFANEGKVLG